MTDVDGAKIAGVLSDLVGQCEAVAVLAGQKAKQEQAAEALSRFHRQQNLTDGLTSTASVAAALRRHGRSH